MSRAYDGFCSDYHVCVLLKAIRSIAVLWTCVCVSSIRWYCASEERKSVWLENHAHQQFVWYHLCAHSIQHGFLFQSVVWSCQLLYIVFFQNVHFFLAAEIIHPSYTHTDVSWGLLAFVLFSSGDFSFTRLRCYINYYERCFSHHKHWRKQ